MKRKSIVSIAFLLIFGHSAPQIASAIPLPKTFDPRDSVVFIFESPQADSPAGTGFLLNIGNDKADFRKDDIYLITNRHVIPKDVKRAAIQFNLNRQEVARWFELDLEKKNKIIDSERPEVDLMAIPVSEAPTDWYVPLQLPAVAKHEDENAAPLHEADDVFTVMWITGGRNGTPQTVPLRWHSAFRYGKVSLITHDRWYSPRDNSLLEQANLVYMQVNPAWRSSGSPLLSQSALERDRHGNPVLNAARPCLVGVNKGYFSGGQTVLTKTHAGGKLKVVETQSYVDLPDEQVATEPLENLREFVETIRKSRKM